MSYERVNWEDSPSTKTPINAQNLNTMDEGISDVDSRVSDAESNINNIENRVEWIERYQIASNSRTVDGVVWEMTEFSTGLVILTGEFNTTVTVSQWGNGYETPSYIKQYPVTFSTPPTFNLSIEGEYSLLPVFQKVQNSATTTRTPSFYGWRPATANQFSATWKMLVVGYVSTN